MKKIHKINTGFLLFSLAMSLILLVTACKKAGEPAPVITNVINYVASPGDSVLTGYRLLITAYLNLPGLVPKASSLILNLQAPFRLRSKSRSKLPAQTTRQLPRKLR